MAPGSGSQVRTAVAAGRFYPGSAELLAADVDALLAGARGASDAVAAGARVRGVIAPHAGYAYSGPIAASAYAALSSVTPPPSRVIILGPSHFVPLRGFAAPSHAAWGTPLGEVAVDDDARRAAVAAGAAIDDEVHRSEHSIEVQLPFIQRCFDRVTVLPLAIGAGDADRGADLLDQLMSAATLLVVSTDLSHYRDAATARRLDARTAAAIEALDDTSLRPDDACGFDPLRVGMAWVRRHGHRVELLDLRTSADTAGDPTRVVGYGAFAITTSHR
jgi:AmmeMemoRadiSam system protein B